MTAPKMGQVNIALIRFHPRNVRRDLGDLRELIASIQQVGVIQPVSLDEFPDYLRLRAGHRRVAAARLAGLTTIPGVIHRTPLTDQQFIVVALHENLHRRDLDPAERASGLAALKAAGMSTLAIAERIGVSANTIRAWAGGGSPELATTAEAKTIAVASAYTNRLRARRPSRQAVLAIVDKWRPIAAGGLDPEKALALVEEFAALIGADTPTEPA